MSANKTRKTVVEADTALKGTLTSACPVVVLGRIDGNVSAPAMEIAASGVVSGNVKAGEISSRGELAGVIEADKLQLSGRVADGSVIRTGSLDVRLGDASTEAAFGDCELEVGERPSKAAAVRSARGLPERAGDGEATDAALAIPQAVAADTSGSRASRRRGHHPHEIV
jgi:hypothetical protein